MAGALAVTAAERAGVEAAPRRRDPAPRVRERLEMVKGAALGHDEAQIAAWSGRAPRTVRRWLRRFGAGGVAALADAPRSGRPPRADAAYQQALETAVGTCPGRLVYPGPVPGTRIPGLPEGTPGGAIGQHTRRGPASPLRPLTPWLPLLPTA